MCNLLRERAEYTTAVKATVIEKNIVTQRISEYFIFRKITRIVWRGDPHLVFKNANIFENLFFKERMLGNMEVQGPFWKMIG